MSRGALVLATRTEIARGCKFACDCRDLSSMMKIAGGYYTFDTVASGPFFNEDGMLCEDASDGWLYYLNELAWQLQGASAALAFIAKVTIDSFVSGSFQCALSTKNNTTNNLQFGFDNAASTTDKYLWLNRAGSTHRSTATVGVGTHVIACCVTNASVALFYVDGVQLGNPVFGVTGTARLSSTTQLVVGNKDGGSAPLGGRLKYARIFRVPSQLEANEVARYV